MKPYADHRKRIGALTLHYFNYPGARTLLIKWREREWRWCLEYRLRFTAERTKPAAPETSRLSESDVQKWPELAIPAAAPGHDVLRVAMARVDEQERAA